MVIPPIVTVEFAFTHDDDAQVVRVTATTVSTCGAKALLPRSLHNSVSDLPAIEASYGDGLL
jgi:hypothetical protein